MEEVVIVSAVRTAIGAYQGVLASVPGPKLGAAAVAEAVKRSGIAPAKMDEILMGCVLTAGLGQAPARQAAIYGGLPNTVRATTVNRVCGSGIKAIMLATQMIQTGDAEVVVAGGMESMSRAPYLLSRARQGYRLGHGKLEDAVILDGLWDPYGDQHMGSCAELCSKEYKLTREDQDRYAAQSYRRAQDAIKAGKFKAEIVPVSVEDKKGPILVDTDEGPGKAKLDKLAELKPAFQKDGTVTAANASSLNDGAAALVLTTARNAKNLGLKPLARVLAQASHAQAPEWFTTAPIGAIRKLLEKAGKKVSDIDVFEINEAFAVVALACAKELGISEDKLNPRGGAVALGHPIGASGARIVVTLLHTLIDEGKRFGVASLCIGGGEGSALLVEKL